MISIGEGRLTIFGLPLSRSYSLDHAFHMTRNVLASAPTRPRMVTFANPLGVRIARRDADYRGHLQRMDLVFCDGIALVLAARRIGGFPLERISFDSTSLAPLVFEYARANGKRIALVGGRPGVADVAAARIGESYPGIPIVGATDGFRSQETLVEHVRALSADIVICGMGAPAQEAFLVALASAGWLGVGFTCGGYLDHLGQRFHFYPRLIDRFNLRWLYRLAREPRRIGYRCVVEYGPFWRGLMREILKPSREKNEV